MNRAKYSDRGYHQSANVPVVDAPNIGGLG